MNMFELKAFYVLQAKATTVQVYILSKHVYVLDQFSVNNDKNMFVFGARSLLSIIKTDTAMYISLWKPTSRVNDTIKLKLILTKAV